MPDDPELALLPANSSLRSLRTSTIDLARRLDPIIASFEDAKAFAELLIEIRRGEATKLIVTRSFKLL